MLFESPFHVDDNADSCGGAGSAWHLQSGDPVRKACHAGVAANKCDPGNVEVDGNNLMLNAHRRITILCAINTRNGSES